MMNSVIAKPGTKEFQKGKRIKGNLQKLMEAEKD
jgi:hypothetical protein